MSEDIKRISQRYRSSGVIIDTNILLLLVVGTFRLQFVPRFKRTERFTTEDFSILINFLKPFKKLYTTPNILTEVNSLINQLPNNLKPAFYPVFAKYIADMSEIYVPSEDISKRPAFPKLGLTDAGIVDAAKGKYLVLTDDYRLAGQLKSMGIDVINFNHLRPY